MPLRGILLLVAFIPCLPVCFFRPFFGVALWVILDIVNPQWYAWSAATDLPWAMLVAIPTLAGFFVFDRGWERFRSREFRIIVLLWAWFTITSLISTNTPLFMHHATATWYRWRFVSKVLLMAVLMISVVHDLRRLRILLLVIAGCFGLFIVKALPFMILTGGAFRLYGPPNSMIADNNDFGLALDMTLPIFFFLAKSETNRRLKRLFGSLFLVAIPAVFFTWSRGAVLGLAVVSILMLLQVKRRFALLPALIFGIGIAIWFAPPAWKTRMNPDRPGALDASAESRLNAWTFCWRLALDHPMTGGGFDTFTERLFDMYAPNPRDVHGPHSVYFGVLAEHGFPGLFLYLSLVIACFWTTSQIVKRARFESDQLILYYGNMLRFSLIGFLTSGAFLGRAYFDYFFTIVACIAALERICLRDQVAEVPCVAEEQAA